MEPRANDDPRRRDLDPADVAPTPVDLPVPRANPTDPADPGYGHGVDDRPPRAVRPPADPAALDGSRDDPLDPPEDRGRYDPDLDRGSRGLGGGRAGGTGP